jgi:multidrug efflux pump subunit AcrA (membrane-fusion protein)
VNANAAPGNGTAPEPAPESKHHLLEELAGLLHAPLQPAEFWAEFLRRVVEALGGVAGAVRTCGDRGEFRLEHQIELTAVGLDQAAHDEALRRVAQADRPLWVPPRGSSSSGGGCGALLAPVTVDGRTAGVLEVWLEPQREANGRRAAAQFLAEVSGFAAAFLHRAQYRELQERQQLWDRYEAFAREVHGSLDPREVACLVANQGRPLVECDQLAVALRRGGAVRVEAVSGAATAEKRSPLVAALAALCDSVMTWSEKLVYAGSRDESLPPAVRVALDAYLRESNGRVLVVLPLRDGHNPHRPPSATLAAESFTPATGTEALDARVERVARHAAPALHNALEYRRAAAGWLTRSRERLREWTRGRLGRKATLILGVLILLIGALVFIPAPLRLDARGQLLPKERQVVYAELNGKVVELKAQHGDEVRKGQELLFVRDLETQLKVEQLGLKVSFAEQRLAALGEQLAKAVTADERNGLLRERINQEYELRKAAVERDLLLQAGASPRKAAVTAPLDGKVVTFDAREQLVGKAVKPGDPLLRVAGVEGPWEIEVLIPEGHVAAVREGLQQAPGGLEVHLLLASQPLKSYKGLLRRDGLGGETVVKDNAVVLPARVEIVDRELLGQLAHMPVGLEVRARIHCGSRSVGYVWFGDLIEFLYEHLLF